MQRHQIGTRLGAVKQRIGDPGLHGATVIGATEVDVAGRNDRSTTRRQEQRDILTDSYRRDRVH